MIHLAHIGILCVRLMLSSLAFLLVYVALFMYEDEQGQLQNRLDELWVRVDDKRRASVGAASAFVQASIRLFNKGLDALYGPKLISVRSVAVTLYYSMASFILLQSFMVVAGVGLKLFLVSPGLSLIAVSANLLLGTSLLFVRADTRTSFVWSWLLLVFAIPAYHFDQMLLKELAVLGFFLPVSGVFLHLFTGVCCDLIFIATNRMLMRWGGRTSSAVWMLVVLASNIVLAATYMLPYVLMVVWLYKRDVTDNVPQVSRLANLYLISSTNFFTALLALAVIVVMFFAIAHLLFWSMINRPIYAIARSRVARKPALLL